MASDLLDELPSCPQCNGPCVPSWRHPRIGSENAKPREMACLACDKTFRAPAMACNSVEDLLEAVHGDVLAELGEHWNRKVAEDREKYERALKGKW